jgi:predicted NBD/HSP70 family sugar kinase
MYAIYVLQENEGATRKSIAGHVGASMVVVSKALGELEQKGFIVKAPMPQDRGGRPTYSYTVQAGAFCTVGLALHADGVSGVLVDSDKRVLAESRTQVTWTDNQKKTASTVKDTVTRLLADLKRDLPGGKSPLAIGVGMPGIVDSHTGTWVRGLQIPGISHLDVAEILKFTGLPVHVEDYTRALAFYEMTVAHGRTLSDFAVVNLGLGVGASIVVNRKIYRGMHGLAGEIGHITVDPNGRRCECGMVGCLETVCSVPGMLESVRQLAGVGVISRIGRGTEGITLEIVLRHLEEGDRLVTTVIAEATGALVTGLATLTKLVNPQNIIVTGPGAALFEPSLDLITTELKRRILPEMEQDLQITFANYQPNQEAWGTALLAADRFWPE